MRANRILPAIIGVVAITVAAGCNAKSKPVKVSGTVTLDGKPIADVLVTFNSTTGGRPASARTDSAGKYELTTFNTGDGALPGEYKVTFKVDVTPEALRKGPGDSSADAKKRAEEALRLQREMAAKKSSSSAIPVSYSNVEKTPHKATVPPAGPLDFALKSDAPSGKK
jgi:hypothetical protein